MKVKSAFAFERTILRLTPQFTHPSPHATQSAFSNRHSAFPHPMRLNQQSAINIQHFLTPCDSFSIQQSTINIQHFPTGQMQVEEGLYSYGARFYDVALGRFISADTLIPQPGSPLAWDRYAYANGNPLKYIDPNGHKPCIDNDSKGGCIIDKEWGNNSSDSSLTKAGSKMLDMFIHYNAQPGWWNNNRPYSMTLNEFLGIWILWEAAGNGSKLEQLLIEAAKNQLWVNDESNLGRPAYCTKGACFNGLFNYMGAYAGAHNDARYAGDVNVRPFFDESPNEFLKKAALIGQNLRTYDSSRVEFRTTVPWGWGNDSEVYRKFSDHGRGRGYDKDQMIYDISNDFLLFNVDQMDYWWRNY